MNEQSPLNEKIYQLLLEIKNKQNAQNRMPASETESNSEQADSSGEIAAKTALGAASVAKANPYMTAAEKGFGVISDVYKLREQQRMSVEKQKQDKIKFLATLMANSQNNIAGMA